MISGIICGPYILGILSLESVTDLHPLEGTCLAISGLAAGAELDLPQLSKSRKQVVGITLAICLSTWVLTYAALDWISVLFPLIPELGGGMDTGHLLAISSLGATLMMTRSPASAIAVLKEVDGKGPFCSLVMAVVVCKDVLVIVAYALNIELIRAAILPAGAKLSLLNFILPLVSVLLAIAVGVCGGLLLSLIMRPKSPLVPNLGSEILNHRAKIVVVILLATGVFHVSHYFDAEPLLSCVTMGMLAVNRRHERVEKDKEDLHLMMAQIMAISNVAFFGLAGASLKLTALKDLLGAALLISLVRLASIYVGAWAGCIVTGTSVETRKVFWMSMVTQAGVAMGLARLAGTRFPDWGPHFQTFMVSE